VKLNSHLPQLQPDTLNRVSYSLVFWKGDTSDAESTYQRLADGRHVQDIDLVDPPSVLTACRQAFGGWSVQANLWTYQLDGNGNGPGFDLEISDHMITFTCYGLQNEQMNQIIDTMSSLKYPLYDPQTGERFRLP
jgi:hypothetical protein